MNGNQIVYRTIVMKGTSEGLDKVVADLNKVAAAHQGVTVASEQTEKSTLSLEQAWKRQTLRLDEAARAQANIAREMKIANQMLNEKRITTEQHAERLNLVNQRYAVTATATKEVAKQTGLARHELINLGRQAQDVGVSLASGQSPLMVLAQQGSQIADVFISSGKSVGSFFSQSINWAKGFAASTAGVVTGLGAIAAGVLYMASSWATAQREIDKALAGPGAASGMTRGGINRIAEQAGGVSGMSVGQAREAATAFAATGKIYEENIASATRMTRDLARAMGTDTAEAAKTLAAALVDPSKGVQDLDKQFGFLDATTLNYIQTLQSQNRLHEAQRVLLDAVAASAKEQADQIGFWARAWDDVTASAGMYSEKLRQIALGLAQVAEQATGVNLGGFTDEQQLDRALQKVKELQRLVSSGSPGLALLNTEQLRAATEEVARLEQKMRDVSEIALDKYFNQVGMEANALAQALIPSIEQARRLEQQIRKLQEAQALGVAGPHTEAALQAAEKQLNIALQTTATLEGQANVVAKLAEAYPGISTELAKQQATLDGQLETIKAHAQAEADIERYLTRIEQLRRQGLTLVEAELKVEQLELRVVQERAAAEAYATQQILNRVDYPTSAFEKQQGVQTNWKENDWKDIATEAGKAAGAAKKLDDEVESTGDHLQRNVGLMQDFAGETRSAAFWAKTMAQQIDETMNLLPSQFGETRGTFSWDWAEGARRSKEWTDKAVKEAEDAMNAAKKGMQAITKAMNGIEDLGTELWDLIKQQQDAIEKRADEIRELNKDKFATGDPYLDAAMFGTAEDMIKAMIAQQKATEDNTAATKAQTDVLSPFYSSDPRRTHLGFRAFAGGGIMTAHGELPLKQYQGGGIATSPQVAVFGEGSTPEAYVPAPSGRIPVVIKAPANNNQRPITVNINIRGNADGSTVAALKSTAFQQAQTMRRALS